MAKILFAITLVIFLLRLIFLSPWLEDWDSVQFAMALHHYSIVENLPHAPGYPLYILLGKIFYFFFRDDNKALTMMSALFGSLSVIPLYMLAKSMFGKLTAIFAVLIFVSTPIEWTLSEVALTNIPGLFFLLLIGYLGYKSLSNKKLLLPFSFVSGFILGIRFTEIPIITGLWAFIFLRKGNSSYLFKGISIFILGIAIWFIPLIFISGVNNFFSSYNWIANYIIHHDAQGGQINRIYQLWNLLKIGYTPFFILLGIVSFIWCATSKNLRSNTAFKLLFIWLFSYLVPLIFIYNLEVPRYTLPLLPPLAIITALFFSRLISKNRIFLISFVIFWVALFRESWRQVSIFQQALPPAISPVLHVKENFNPSQTTLVTTFIYRQFQYYAPEFSNYYGVNNTPAKFESEIVIIDYDKIKDQLPALHQYDIKDIKKFSGPADIFPRISQTNLYILKRHAENK
ncbi:glycosyltransferase family 39 protein [Candidatus Microgenomates bacterium]|nr:glycosyltransferase family 39 protein [Candidatus Microgenomates bacterium]